MTLQSTVSGSRTIKSAKQLRKLLCHGTSYLGTFGELSHEQFVDIVHRNGGIYVPYSNHAPIALLVIGDAALPITPAGQAISMPCESIAAERRFLQLLNETIDEHLYSIRMLAQLLKIPQPRIRAWVKAGLIQPAASDSGARRFDFRQVAIARTLCDLTDAGITIAQLRRSLQKLSHCLPDLKEPLQQLAVLEANGPLLVRLEEGELSEVDGQLRMTFDSEPFPEPVQMRLMPGPRSPADWHEQGIDQEKRGLLEEAEHSYRQALLLGGPDAQTCFDLAALLALRGRREQAIERYRQVIELDTSRFDAWNNLGILLAEINDPDAAVDAFRQAVRLNPQDELAHYNLADTLESMRQASRARPHWQQFLAVHGIDDAHSRYARSRMLASS